MSSYVWSFLLNVINERCEKIETGLYRDYELATIKNWSGPLNEQGKKFIQKIFKDKGLDIVIQCDMKIVHYLDVTLDLNTGTTKPYRKPDDETNYINGNSDHPPSIIYQLPFSVEKQ